MEKFKPHTRFLRALMRAAIAGADHAKHLLRAAPSKLSGSYVPDRGEYVTRLSCAAKVVDASEYRILKVRQEKARASLNARGIRDPKPLYLEEQPDVPKAPARIPIDLEDLPLG